MTTIGNLSLCFTSADGLTENTSALVCFLTRPLTSAFAWSTAANTWTVEVAANSRFIVAKTRSRLNFAQTKQQGIAAVMQALDIASVSKSLTSSVESPGDYLIARFYENEELKLRYCAVMEQPMSIAFNLEIRDEDGRLVSQPIPPTPVWNRSFRYYRLSQLSSDVYEAYRNLYLAYEALAESLFPRGKDEKESVWVRRSFLQADQRFSLSQFAPENHRNPSDYLFGTLYEHVRCNLFHSRKADSILPFYDVEPTKVQRAYQTLLRVWRHVVSGALRIGEAGPVITYGGYKAHMSSIFNQSLRLEVSNDATPASVEDTAVAPSGALVVSLAECTYSGEVDPGAVGVVAQERDVVRLPRIHRLGLRIEDTLYCISEITEGLAVGMVDVFEVALGFRLVQSTLPKTDF